MSLLHRAAVIPILLLLAQMIIDHIRKTKLNGLSTTEPAYRTYWFTRWMAPSVQQYNVAMLMKVEESLEEIESRGQLLLRGLAF